MAYGLKCLVFQREETPFANHPIMRQENEKYCQTVPKKQLEEEPGSFYIGHVVMQFPKNDAEIYIDQRLRASKFILYTHHKPQILSHVLLYEHHWKMVNGGNYMVPQWFV